MIFITGDVIGLETKDFLSKNEVVYINKLFIDKQLKKEINSKLVQQKSLKVIELLVRI